MASKRRVNWISQQRVDVPDMRAVESAVSNDFDELIQSFVTGIGKGYILRGFEISMAGAIGGAASGLQLIVDPGAVFHPTSSQSGTSYLVPSGTLPQQLNSATNTIIEGAFAPSAINYISLEYERFIDDATSSQVYLWNPTTNNETTKNTPRAQILRYRIRITTSLPANNYLPIASVTTDSGNNVVRIDDARNLLFSQGKGGYSPDPFYQYTFSEGNEPNPTFSQSNSVNPFQGGDKAIGTLKDWMNSVTSEIQRIKGTTYWSSLSSSGSLESLRADLGNTIITGRGTISHSSTTPGLMNWSDDIVIRIVGSRLAYTLLANPTSTNVTLSDDKVAYINLTRGVTVTPSLVFTNSSPIITSVGSIAWTGPLQAGDWIKLGSATDSAYYKISTVDSLTQVTLTEPYLGASTGPGGAKAKYAFGNYASSASPSTSRDIFVVNRADVPEGENIFWLMLRSDNGGTVPRVYVRFLGAEIQSGVTEDISDNTPRNILTYIGSPIESATRPQYTSAISSGATTEVQDLTFGTAAEVDQNDAFVINSANNFRKYYVWFNKDGSGVDPQIPQRIPLVATISTGMSAASVANAVVQALGSSYYPDFTAVESNANPEMVRVTWNSAGATVGAANFSMNSPFAITTITSGAGTGNNIVNDGDSLTLAIKKLDRALGEYIQALDTPTYDENLDTVTGSTTTTVTGVIEQALADDYNLVAASSGGPYTINQRYGAWFTAAQPGTITDFTMRMSGASGTFSKNVTAYVFADNGSGAPGAIIGTSTVTSCTFNFSTKTNYSFNFSTPVSIVAGQNYFVAVGFDTLPVSPQNVLFWGTNTGNINSNLGFIQTLDYTSAGWFVGSKTSSNEIYAIIAGTQVTTTGTTPGAGQIAASPSGTVINLPLNSRLSNVQQKYTVGRGVLQVHLNGQLLRLGIDWSEVGSAGQESTQITTLQNIVGGDALNFRLGVGGGSASGGGGGQGPQGDPGPTGPAGQDALGGPITISTKNSNYTILLNDKVTKVDASSGNLVITLPSAASAIGKVFYVKKVDTTGNTVTVQANGAELIDGFNTKVITAPYDSLMLISDGSVWSLH